MVEWITDELKSVDLGDARRNVRLGTVLGDLVTQPNVSLPAAVGGGRAETEAVYRFFENPHFDFGDVLTPHCDATLERICQQKVVILAQDTTEIDLTRPKQQVQGAGPLDAGPRRGCFLHETHAFTDTAISLGTVAAETWARPELTSSRKSRADRKKERRHTPIEEKESYRWITGMKHAHYVATQAPNTEVISLADSEADIYEMLVAGQFPNYQFPNEEASPQEPAESLATTPQASFIIRGCQNRVILPEIVVNEADSQQSDALHEEDPEQKTYFTTIYSKAEAQPVIETYEVYIRGRDPKVNCETRERRQARETRTGIVEVRACSMTLQPPPRPDRQLPEVSINVILVREVNPPAGESPIEWLLLTNLPIGTPKQVMRVIEIYKIRWQVEIFFRVLKQGCRIEDRRFETIETFWRYLGVALMVAWRTMYVMRMGRECPDVSCEAVFDVSEWKSVYQVTQKKKPTTTPPPLRGMVRMVGQLGGFVNRTPGEEPGVETIWKGLQRMHDMALCWDCFGPRSMGGFETEFGLRSHFQLGLSSEPTGPATPDIFHWANDRSRSFPLCMIFPFRPLHLSETLPAAIAMPQIIKPNDAVKRRLMLNAS